MQEHQQDYSGHQRQGLFPSPDSTPIGPDGYFMYCYNNRIIVQPYLREYNPRTGRYHYTPIGDWQYTGDTCSQTPTLYGNWRVLCSEHYPFYDKCFSTNDAAREDARVHNNYYHNGNVGATYFSSDCTT